MVGPLALLTVPTQAFLFVTEDISKNVEEIGFRFIPGFDKFDKAMQLVADKLNSALGLEETGEADDATIISSVAVRSDML